MRKIVITDLTRFKTGDDVCTAGTDLDTGECVRPMPYLTETLCKKLGIMPGAILQGDFVAKSGLVGPHQEDALYTPDKLSFDGPTTSEKFKAALEAGLKDSIEDGFKIKLTPGQKYIPIGHPIGHSIITLEVDPKTIEIVEDGFTPGKTKIHFTDGSGRRFSFLPITDLGFHRYADRHRAARDLAPVNDLIRAQDQAYLRVGLGRAWQNPSGINGYWMQVNGVYTFPRFFEQIRSYK